MKFSHQNSSERIVILFLSILFDFFLVPSSRRVLSRLIKFIASTKFYLYFIVYVLLMVFQLNFKGPYHNIGLRLGNVLVVCDLYGLPLHSNHFSVLKLFWVEKSPFHVL